MVYAQSISGPTSTCPLGSFSLPRTSWECPNTQRLGRCCRCQSQACSAWCPVSNRLARWHPGLEQRTTGTASGACWALDGHCRPHSAAAVQSALLLGESCDLKFLLLEQKTQSVRSSPLLPPSTAEPALCHPREETQSRSVAPITQHCSPYDSFSKLSCQTDH